MPDGGAREPVEVLLVEDDPGDVLMVRQALDGDGADRRLSVVSNGEDALAYLHKQGRYAQAPTPDLVLLDLNLPRRSGREVLHGIKSDPDLRRLPVVVLTTSDAEQDVLASYDLHCNAYVRKPVDARRFFAAVRAIDEFFLDVVRLPAR